MLTNAPWLQPPDFVGAMAKGASLGLDSAKLSQEGAIAGAQLLEDARKAAGQLGLGYAQVAADNQKAAAELSMKQALSDIGTHQWNQEESDKQRQIDLEAQKFAAERERPIHVADSLIAPLSGKVVYQGQPKPVSPLGKLYVDREAALKTGDPERIKAYDAAIQEATTNHGRSIYMGQDDAGKPIFQMTEGGSKPIGSVGAPTVATQSMAQKKLLQYQNSSELLNYLQHNLKPEHVGARGAAGEFFVDKTLSQLIPDVANKDRIDVRSTLTAARESLMREMSDDQRFSKTDREEVSKALPSNGVFESYEDAQQRLSTVRRILSSRGKTYSQSLGQKPPLWSMSPDEIKASFQRGEIKEDEAVDALTRFH